MSASLLSALAFIVASPAQSPAQAGGPGFDRSMVEPLYEITEFVLGRKLRRKEKRRIAADAKMRYLRNPQGYTAEMAKIREATAKLRSLRGQPVAVAAMQDLLLGQFYFQAQGKPPTEVPAAVSLMFEQVPVVAANPTTQVVVTQRDVAALLAMDRFFTKLAGAPRTFGKRAVPLLVAAARQWTVAGHQLGATFAKLYESWAAIQWAWSRLSRKQRRAFWARVRAGA